MEKFALTTKEGLKKALLIGNDLLLKSDPVSGLGKYIYDKFSEKTVSQVDQSKIVETLIRKGKEEGVDEMEIKMDNMKGLDLSVPIEGAEIKSKVGSDEKTYIKVKYK